MPCIVYEHGCKALVGNEVGFAFVPILGFEYFGPLGLCHGFECLYGGGFAFACAVGSPGGHGYASVGGSSSVGGVVYKSAFVAEDEWDK